MDFNCPEGLVLGPNFWITEPSPGPGPTRPIHLKPDMHWKCSSESDQIRKMVEGLTDRRYYFQFY